jgi:hypothetical protein
MYLPTTKTTMEETNVENVTKYIHFIFYHFPRISGTVSKVERG